MDNNNYGGWKYEKININNAIITSSRNGGCKSQDSKEELYLQHIQRL